MSDQVLNVIRLLPIAALWIATFYFARACLASSRHKKPKITQIVCPDCGCDQWIMGPTGGLSQNIQCASCESRFNYMGPLGMERLSTVWERLEKPKKAHK